MQYIKLTKRDDFSKELTKRVNDYLKSTKKDKSGSWQIFMKAPILFAFYFTPFILFLTGVLGSSLGSTLLVGAWMGLGMAFIGLSIMHDAVHGAFSKYNWLNKLMGYSLEMLGGSSLTWKIQHNVLHHSFTNVEGMDEDISGPPFLRFSPNGPKRGIHRFQVFYAWFFYGMMTMLWVTAKDYMQLVRYNKMNLLGAQNTTLKRELIRLTVSKIIYITVMIIVPLLVTDVIWWHWVLGFLLLHFVCGVVLAFVFQSAHVVPETEFYTSETHDVVNPTNSWAKHQLATTANFENWNKVLTWFVGGLNHQIEHHLFPEISHIHYPKIAKIVKKTAQEYGCDYNYHRTFVGAIFSHLRLLHRLGNA
jgi:linoleoyl-CoA desaturase